MEWDSHEQMIRSMKENLDEDRPPHKCIFRHELERLKDICEEFGWFLGQESVSEFIRRKLQSLE